jgi:hypothetical protein
MPTVNLLSTSAQYSGMGAACCGGAAAFVRGRTAFAHACCSRRDGNFATALEHCAAGLDAVGRPGASHVSGCSPAVAWQAADLTLQLQLQQAKCQAALVRAYATVPSACTVHLPPDLAPSRQRYQTCMCRTNGQRQWHPPGLWRLHTFGTLWQLLRRPFLLQPWQRLHSSVQWPGFRTRPSLQLKVGLRSVQLCTCHTGAARCSLLHQRSEVFPCFACKWNSRFPWWTCTYGCSRVEEADGKDARTQQEVKRCRRQPAWRPARCACAMSPCAASAEVRAWICVLTLHSDVVVRAQSQLHGFAAAQRKQTLMLLVPPGQAEHSY